MVPMCVCVCVRARMYVCIFFRGCIFNSQTLNQTVH